MIEVNVEEYGHDLRDVHVHRRLIRALEPIGAYAKEGQREGKHRGDVEGASATKRAAACRLGGVPGSRADGVAISSHLVVYFHGGFLRESPTKSRGITGLLLFVLNEGRAKNLCIIVRVRGSSRMAVGMNAAAPILLFVLAPATAKTVAGTVTLSSQVTEEFMAKFSFSPNLASTISGTFHTDLVDYFDGHPHDMALCLYDEKKWAEFQQALKKGSLCAERRQMASWSTKIMPTLQDDKARHEFSFRSSLKPTDSSSAHYWFAVLMDCYLEEYDAHPPLMHYELRFLNGRSHLPGL